MAAVHTVPAENFSKYMDVAADPDPEAQPTSKTTILDLNEDCWRTILDYIHEAQIVCSERVSRGWQAVVHRYFRGAGICFVPFSNHFKHHDSMILAKNRVFTIDFRSIHNRSETEDVLAFLDKWGPSIVHTMCPSPEAFEKITKCCPQLTSLAITMNTFRSTPLSQDQVEFMAMLERIVFIDYTYEDHATMDKQRTQLELEFHTEVYHRSHIFENIPATCDLWHNLRPTNLKSLTFRGMFDFQYFLGAVDCFPELTDLNVQGEIYNVRVLLDRTPKLERLCMMQWSDERAEPGSIRSVCGLQRLKTLVLWDCTVRGWWLEAVLRDCPELEVLEMSFKRLNLVLPVLPISAQTLCETVGRSLTVLRIPGRNLYLQDSDVATLIEGCPNLTTLDVRACYQLSGATLALAARARATRGRPRPLWLLVGGTAGYYEVTQGADLVMHADDTCAFDKCLRPRQYISSVASENC